MYCNSMFPDYFISSQYNFHYHPSLVVRSEKIIVFKIKRDWRKESLVYFNN